MATATTTLSSPAEVLRLIGASTVLACDLETTGLDPRTDRIRLLSLHNGKRTVILDCFEHPIQQFLPPLADKILVAHNALFDLSFLYNAGLTDLPETICTYLLAQLVTAGEGEHGFPSLSLASCCYRWLGGMLLDKGLQASDWSGLLTPEQLGYAARDVEVLPLLLKALDAELTRGALHRVADIEMRALPAFVWMSQSGVPFDREAWVELARKAAAEVKRLEEALDAKAPPKGEAGLFGHHEKWNWNSPEQVKSVFEMLDTPVDTTQDAQLALIPGPFAATLREHREHAQLVKMYGPNWLRGAVILDGRVYPNWRQIGAATGRSACAQPNMMQIPRRKEYRNCVRAVEGRTLVKCDYATLQMRIACDIARDLPMFQAFEAEAQGGPDIHTATARMLLGKDDVTKADRQIAKSAGFGLLFGMSAAGLRVYSKTTYGVDFTEDEAARHRSTWLAGYPGIARWHQGAYRGKHTHTKTRLGRRRILPPKCSATWVLNSPVQGTEADGAKAALALLWERRAECPGVFPVIFNHDEIVLDSPAEQAEEARLWLEAAMLDGMQPQIEPVPCKVEGKVTLRWGG